MEARIIHSGSNISSTTLHDQQHRSASRIEDYWDLMSEDSNDVSIPEFPLLSPKTPTVQRVTCLLPLTHSRSVADSKHAGLSTPTEEDATLIMKQTEAGQHSSQAGLLDYPSTGSTFGLSLHEESPSQEVRHQYLQSKMADTRAQLPTKMTSHVTAAPEGAPGNLFSYYLDWAHNPQEEGPSTAWKEQHFPVVKPNLGRTNVERENAGERSQVNGPAVDVMDLPDGDATTQKKAVAAETMHVQQHFYNQWARLPRTEMMENEDSVPFMRRAMTSLRMLPATGSFKTYALLGAIVRDQRDLGAKWAVAGTGMGASSIFSNRDGNPGGAVAGTQQFSPNGLLVKGRLKRGLGLSRSPGGPLTTSTGNRGKEVDTVFPLICIACSSLITRTGSEAEWSSTCANCPEGLPGRCPVSSAPGSFNSRSSLQTTASPKDSRCYEAKDGTKGLESDPATLACCCLCCCCVCYYRKQPNDLGCDLTRVESAGEKGLGFSAEKLKTNDEIPSNARARGQDRSDDVEEEQDGEEESVNCEEDDVGREDECKEEKSEIDIRCVCPAGEREGSPGMNTSCAACYPHGLATVTGQRSAPSNKLFREDSGYSSDATAAAAAGHLQRPHHEHRPCLGCLCHQPGFQHESHRVGCRLLYSDVSRSRHRFRPQNRAIPVKKAALLFSGDVDLRDQRYHRQFYEKRSKQSLTSRQLPPPPLGDRQLHVLNEDVEQTQRARCASDISLGLVGRFRGRSAPERTSSASHVDTRVAGNKSNEKDVYVDENILDRKEVSPDPQENTPIREVTRVQFIDLAEVKNTLLKDKQYHLQVCKSQGSFEGQADRKQIGEPLVNEAAIESNAHAQDKNGKPKPKKPVPPLHRSRSDIPRTESIPHKKREANTTIAISGMNPAFPKSVSLELLRNREKMKLLRLRCSGGNPQANGGFSFNVPREKVLTSSLSPAKRDETAGTRNARALKGTENSAAVQALQITSSMVASTAAQEFSTAAAAAVTPRSAAAAPPASLGTAAEGKRSASVAATPLASSFLATSTSSSPAAAAEGKGRILNRSVRSAALRHYGLRKTHKILHSFSKLWASDAVSLRVDSSSSSAKPPPLDGSQTQGADDGAAD